MYALHLLSSAGPFEHISSHIPSPLVIPPILEDCQRKMQSWGTSGTFDPFTNVYEVRRVLPVLLSTEVWLNDELLACSLPCSLFFRRPYEACPVLRSRTMLQSSLGLKNYTTDWTEERRLLQSCSLGSRCLPRSVNSLPRKRFMTSSCEPSTPGSRVALLGTILSRCYSTWATRRWSL